MMPILVKSDDVRSGRKAKARHGRLQAAQESMGKEQSNLFYSRIVLLFGMVLFWVLYPYHPCHLKTRRGGSLKKNLSLFFFVYTVVAVGRYPSPRLFIKPGLEVLT